MKNPKKIIIAIILCLAVTLVSTSCDNDSENKTEVDGMKIDIGKIKVDVPKVNVSEFKFEKEYTDSKKISNLLGVTKAVVDVEVGNISVSYNSGAIARINVRYHASTVKEKDLSTILSQTSLDVLVKGNSLYVSINKKDRDTSAWTWFDKNISKYNLSADIEISLPKVFSIFDIKSDTGSISIDGLQGTFIIEADTGNIETRNIKFSGSSKFTLDTGNIDLSLSKELTGNSEIEISTDTGDISIKLEGLPYERIDTSSIVYKSVVVNRKCKIRASTDTGHISIN